MSDLKEKEVAVEAEVVKEKPYTLRELNDEDLYTVLEIIAIALPEEAKESFAQKVSESVDKGGKKDNKKDNKTEKLGVQVAFDLVRYIMKNMKSVKTEVYAFLSDLSGIPADDIRKMPFGTTPAMLKEVFMNTKNADFFTELFKSLK